ncbi:MAG TPA: DNA polymerase [Dehalococcoidia bacterium]|nr:DNA polymerase [Dehalococcoidia bacterium]
MTVTFDAGQFRRRGGYVYGVVRVLEHGAQVFADGVNLTTHKGRAAFGDALAGRLNGTCPDPATVEARLLEILAAAESALDAAAPAGAADGDGDTSDTPPAPGGRGPSQATRLVRLAAELGIDLFHTPDERGFATYPIGDHRETRPLRSGAFRRYLAGELYRAEGATPGGQALQDALTVLDGQAYHAGPEQPVFLRVAEAGGALYLDLADDGWHAVAITAAGWRVVSDPPVRFWRPAHTQALPEPLPGGDVSTLRRYVNVGSDDDFLLLVTWLLQAFRGRGPYPVLALLGGQGRAKSTTGRVLKELLDPAVPPLRAEPREPRDLAVAANNTWLLSYDNFSRLPGWLSDALCRLSTGGGFGTRQMYSDDEERVFDAMRPVLLTGITDFIERGDLLDRALLLYPPPLHTTVPERQFWPAFEHERPRLLGALFDALSAGLRNEPQVSIARPPRMADYACWGAALAPALGATAEIFLAAYTGNRADATALPLDDSPLVKPLTAFMRDFAAAAPWEGTATELLAKLGEYLSETELKRLPAGWPKQANQLTNALRRLAPSLAAIAIGVEFERAPHSRTRLIRLWWMQEPPDSEEAGNPSSPSSPSSPLPPDGTDSRVDGAGLGDDPRCTGDDAHTDPSSPKRGHRPPSSPDRADSTPETPSGDDGDDGDDLFRSCSKTATATNAAAAPGTACPTAPAFERITDATRLRAVLPELARAPLLGLDTETTGLDPHRDRLRLLQLATPERVYVVDAFHVEPRLLAPLFAGPDSPRLAGHNLAFDLRFLMAAELPVPDGARLFDTMLAAQLLAAGEPSERGTFTLATVADRCAGLTLDKTEQRSDWSGPLTDAQLRYATLDAAVLLPLAERLQAELHAARLERVADIEMRALPALAWLTHTGAPFDADRWLALSNAAVAERLTLGDDLTKAAGTGDMFEHSTINWDSPAQVAALLRARGHDVPRADEATLTALAAAEPLAPLLLRYRDASKRAGTYGITFLEHVTETTGRIHADYRQLGAASGRMACTRPNLQNIPRDPAYRACFRPAPGRVLIKADYSQIELRLAAQISSDAALRSAFARGDDLHARTAAAVLSKAADAVTKDERQLAKALNFGLTFGMGATALREYVTGYGVTLSQPEAVRFRDAFFRAYPGLRAWHEREGRGKDTETRTLTGRRRLGVEKFTERLNSPVQGSGADVLKLALARLWEDRAAQPAAAPVLCVHDEIVIECDAGEAEAVAAWLRGHMEAAGAELVPDVPIACDVTIAQDWAGSPL